MRCRKYSEDANCKCKNTLDWPPYAKEDESSGWDFMFKVCAGTQIGVGVVGIFEKPQHTTEVKYFFKSWRFELTLDY